MDRFPSVTDILLICSRYTKLGNPQLKSVFVYHFFSVGRRAPAIFGIVIDYTSDALCRKDRIDKCGDNGRCVVLFYPID